MSRNYLGYNDLIRTITLSHFNNETLGARVIYISTNGIVAHSGVQNTPSIYPVINLKSNVLINGGDGTASNPYEVTINN